jgi:hypothetical protein
MGDPFAIVSELVRRLGEEQKAGGFQFLLIGGYGLEAHGVQRDTRDIDFAVVTESVPQAERVLSDLGFVRTDLSHLCGRYFHPEPGVIPVDLLLVNQSTMNKLQQDSVTHQFLGHSIPAPSVASFIALKLHAIKWNPKRMGKDGSDIVRLMEQNPSVISMDRLRELCDQFGAPGVFAKLQILLEP